MNTEAKNGGSNSKITLTPEQRFKVGMVITGAVLAEGAIAAIF